MTENWSSLGSESSAKAAQDCTRDEGADHSIAIHFASVRWRRYDLAHTTALYIESFSSDERNQEHQRDASPG